jgi:hypothetical protein
MAETLAGSQLLDLIDSNDQKHQNCWSLWVKQNQEIKVEGKEKGLGCIVESSRRKKTENPEFRLFFHKYFGFPYDAIPRERGRKLLLYLAQESIEEGITLSAPWPNLINEADAIDNLKHLFGQVDLKYLHIVVFNLLTKLLKGARVNSKQMLLKHMIYVLKQLAESINADTTSSLELDQKGFLHRPDRPDPIPGNDGTEEPQIENDFTSEDIEGCMVCFNDDVHVAPVAKKQKTNMVNSSTAGSEDLISSTCTTIVEPSNVFN